MLWPAIFPACGASGATCPGDAIALSRRAVVRGAAGVRMSKTALCDVKVCVPVAAPGVAFRPPHECARESVAAIARGDAQALHDAVAAAQLPAATARALGLQAWRADVARGSVGLPLAAGGLLSAVYTGVRTSQERAGTLQYGDNAAVFLVELAATLDETAIVDMMVDSGLRDDPKNEQASIEATAGFLAASGATRCAERLLARKGEFVAARRNRLLYEHARERALRNAKRILERRVCGAIAVAALRDVVDDHGSPQVVSMGNVVMTVGLSLVGLSEFLVLCESEKSTARVCDRVREVARRSMSGEEIGAMKGASLGKSHPMASLIAGTKHLRRAGVPPIAVLEM